jgi:hypothetical protein
MSVISERLQKTRSTEEELAVLVQAAFAGAPEVGQDMLATVAGFDVKTQQMLSKILYTARQRVADIDDRKDTSALNKELEMFREENRVLKKRLTSVETRVLEALRVEGIR